MTSPAGTRATDHAEAAAADWSAGNWVKFLLNGIWLKIDRPDRSRALRQPGGRRVPYKPDCCENSRIGGARKHSLADDQSTSHLFRV